MLIIREAVIGEITEALNKARDACLDVSGMKLATMKPRIEPRVAAEIALAAVFGHVVWGAGSVMIDKSGQPVLPIHRNPHPATAPHTPNMIQEG